MHSSHREKGANGTPCIIAPTTSGLKWLTEEEMELWRSGVPLSRWQLQEQANGN